MKINTMAGYALIEHVRPFFVIIPGDHFSEAMTFYWVMFIGVIWERSNIENILLTYCEYFRKKITLRGKSRLREQKEDLLMSW